MRSSVYCYSEDSVNTLSTAAEQSPALNFNRTLTQTPFKQTEGEKQCQCLMDWTQS